MRLFADELIEAGVTPRALMKAQGFDPAPLALLKANFNPDQPRVPAGSGRDSGEWSGGASVDTAGVKDFIARLLLEAARRAARALLRPSEPEKANFNPAQPRWPAGSGRDSGEWSGDATIDTAGLKEFIARLLLEAARRAARRLLRPSEPKPANPEVVKPETKPLETPETEQPSVVDANKVHHIFDNPDHSFGEFLYQYGSQEEAFRAIEDATRKVIEEQKITDDMRYKLKWPGINLGSQAML